MAAFAEKFFGTLLRLIASLPWCVLHFLSSATALTAHKIVGYRINIVRANLRTSFPEKSADELKSIEKDFYRRLADYFFETIKILSISKEEMSQRMHFKNVDDIASLLRSGRDISLFFGHYCNWEWVSSMPAYLPENSVVAYVYHPLENATSDRIFLRLRCKYGAVPTPMKTTLRHLLQWENEGRTSLTGYIADQVPTYESIHYWTEFLNHDTGVFTGAEKISRRLHAAAFYLDIRRTSRSRYEAEFIELTPDAAALPEYRLTQLYFRNLEKSIVRDPASWLWTHRRWKRNREEWERRFPDRKSPSQK